MTVPETSDPSARIGVLDRAGAERPADGLLKGLRQTPSTRVLLVQGDATPLDDAGALALVSSADVPEDAEWAFLGRDARGDAVLVASLSTEGGALEGWRALRSLGGDLPADDVSALVTAVALGRWLRDAEYCPACGAQTRLRNSGWSRSCPSCGREHFPRTDPAVIVAVTRDDDPDRLLLGSNALWPQDRYSCFAGFAEAGESLEDTVVREVLEEAGVRVSGLRYVGSQGWPYPRSLMLGFFATAADPDAARGDGDEIVDARWFTRAEIGEALEGRGAVQLPGAASIARRLITRWHAERPE